MTTLAEKIAVMQAAERGEKIQAANRGSPNNWQDAATPTWCWDSYNYRVKPIDPLRKMQTEDYIPGQQAYFPASWAVIGISSTGDRTQVKLMIKRGDAYVTEQGALAAAKKLWGDTL